MIYPAGGSSIVTGLDSWMDGRWLLRALRSDVMLNYEEQMINVGR